MVKVNSDCIGCRACAQICSEGFQMREGKAVVINEEVDCIEKAAEACPTNAIVLDKESEKMTLEKPTEPHTNHVDNNEPRNLSGGQGRGSGQGKGKGGGQGLGPGGKCICPQCGYEEPHERGTPCYQKECPECGAKMTRE